MRKRHIGYIGLGQMGGAMAGHLIESGYPVTVYDISNEAIQSFVDKGATAATSAKDVAEQAEIIITCLPNPAIVEATALGENGIIEGLSPGKIYMDMSTIEPDTTRRVGAAIHKNGAHMLDVPVGLTPNHAARGELVLMIGGDNGIVNEVQDILDTLGNTQHYCGDLGAGIATKLINNFVAISNNAVVSEAFALAVKAGLDPEHTRQVLLSTAAKSAALEGSLLQIFERDFVPTFKLSLAHKDIGLAAYMGNSLGVPNFMAAAVHQLQKLAMGKDLGNETPSAVIKVIEETAGVIVQSQKHKEQ